MWQDGLLDRLPAEIDHTIVDVAEDADDGGSRCCSATSAPAGAGRVSILPMAQHRRFLDHMATMHARVLGFEDRIGLPPPGPGTPR